MKLTRIAIVLILFFCNCTPENRSIHMLSEEYFIDGKCEELFQHYQHFLIPGEDSIRYHTFSQRGIDSTENILLYVQGSGSEPIFSIKTDGQGYWINGSMPINLNDVPDNYLLVLISKFKIPFCISTAEEYVQQGT